MSALRLVVDRPRLFRCWWCGPCGKLPFRPSRRAAGIEVFLLGLFCGLSSLPPLLVSHTSRALLRARSSPRLAVRRGRGAPSAAKIPARGARCRLLARLARSIPCGGTIRALERDPSLAMHRCARSNSFPEAVESPAFLRGEAAGDRVGLLGSEPQIPFLSGMPSANRLPLRLRNDGAQPPRQGHARDLIRRTRASAPALAVWLGQRPHCLLAPRARQPTLLLELAPRWLEEHYEVVGCGRCPPGTARATSGESQRAAAAALFPTTSGAAPAGTNRKAASLRLCNPATVHHRCSTKGVGVRKTLGWTLVPGPRPWRERRSPSTARWRSTSPDHAADLKWGSPPPVFESDGEVHRRSAIPEAGLYVVRPRRAGPVQDQSSPLAPDGRAP